MTPPQPDEPLSIGRVIEFAVAILALALLAGSWAYSWFKGSLLAGLWYGG